jgi:hypothetical protein
MALSKQSIETLMDLVEIKISYMDVLDRDDAKQLRILERCREELKAVNAAAGAELVPFVRTQRRVALQHDLAAV